MLKRVGVHTKATTLGGGVVNSMTGNTCDSSLRIVHSLLCGEKACSVTQLFHHCSCGAYFSPSRNHYGPCNHLQSQYTYQACLYHSHERDRICIFSQHPNIGHLLRTSTVFDVEVTSLRRFKLPEANRTLAFSPQDRFAITRRWWGRTDAYSVLSRELVQSVNQHDVEEVEVSNSGGEWALCRHDGAIDLWMLNDDVL